MPPKRLYDEIHDRCLPPGTLGHDACHARDAEEIARLTRERDEARAEVKHWRDAWAEAQVKLDTRPDVEAERDRLRALLQRLEWDKAGYCPICFPGEAPYRHTTDCPLGRALEGRDA